MTDKKELKKVEENMDNNKETHSEDTEQVGTTKGVVGTVTPKDTPKEDETITPKEIPKENEIPELVVDDSEKSFQFIQV